MVQMELRIVLATILMFIALAGIAVAIHGLLFNQPNATLYGVIAIGTGITGCVVLLNVWPKDTHHLP